MENKELLLVGSVPLDTAEDVIQAFGPSLGSYLSCIPDGEVGDRRWWVLRLSHQVFNGHPELEILKRPPPENGVERLVPRDRSEMWQFKVRDGIPAVQFGDPGWRLGFARDAVNSYFVFRKLRAEGIFPKHLRFQISLPLVNSVVSKFTFPVEGDLERVRPGYEAAVSAEIQNIIKRIPAEDLALQWDCSMQITDIYGGFPELPQDGALERNVGQIARLSKDVPQEVMLGFHFCFGTFGGWPRFSPDDLGAAVDLANAAVSVAGRRIDWVNIPVLDRSDDEFYQPLEKLRLRDSRIFLGAIHNMDRFSDRLKTAKKYLPKFGLSAYCGFGRLSPEELPGIIDAHLQAVKVGREIGVLDAGA